MIPNTAGLYNVGSTTKPWKNGNFSGIVTATNLNIAGVTTFVGVGTFNSDLSVGGDLNINGSIQASTIDGGSF